MTRKYNIIKNLSLKRITEKFFYNNKCTLYNKAITVISLYVPNNIQYY